MFNQFDDSENNFMSIQDDFRGDNYDQNNNFYDPYENSNENTLHKFYEEEEYQKEFNKGFEETFLNNPFDDDEYIEKQSTESTEKKENDNNKEKEKEQKQEQEIEHLMPKEDNDINLEKNEQSFYLVKTEHFKKTIDNNENITNRIEEEEDEEEKEKEASSNIMNIDENVENDEIISSTKNTTKKSNKNYTSDIIGKKVRMEVLTNLKDFINEKIKYYYNNDIKKGIHLKQFLEFDKTNIIHSNVNYDKKFLNFKLGFIFSWDLSKKITNHLKDHNHQLLQELVSSEIAGNYFTELFNTTFIQCLKHIQGKENIDVLNGINKIDQIFEKYKDDKNYYNNLVENMKNYENILNNKRARNSKKSKKG